MKNIAIEVQHGTLIVLATKNWDMADEPAWQEALRAFSSKFSEEHD